MPMKGGSDAPVFILNQASKLAADLRSMENLHFFISYPSLQLHTIAEIAVAGVVGIDDHLFEHYLRVDHDDAEDVLTSSFIDFCGEPPLLY